MSWSTSEDAAEESLEGTDEGPPLSSLVGSETVGNDEDSSTAGEDEGTGRRLSTVATGDGLRR